MKESKLILVTGAARSGKSLFAEQLVTKEDSRVAYLATAQALDREMEERIHLHRIRRPQHWQTFEEPFHPAEVLLANHELYRVWLLDCLTLYVSNLFFNMAGQGPAEALPVAKIQEHILEEIEKLINCVKKTGVTLVAVTSEVGWGLVPPDPQSRAYRDILGRVNQRLGQAADEVYLVAVGIPLQLK